LFTLTQEAVPEHVEPFVASPPRRGQASKFIKHLMDSLAPSMVKAQARKALELLKDTMLYKPPFQSWFHKLIGIYREIISNGEAPTLENILTSCMLDAMGNDPNWSAWVENLETDLGNESLSIDKLQSLAAKKDLRLGDQDKKKPVEANALTNNGDKNRPVGPVNRQVNDKPCKNCGKVHQQGRCNAYGKTCAYEKCQRKNHF